jgi:hypothetical protein
MATEVFTPADATGSPGGQGSHGTQLAVSLFWMWRKEWNYEQVIKFGSHVGQPVNRHGVK